MGQFQHKEHLSRYEDSSHHKDKTVVTRSCFTMIFFALWSKNVVRKDLSYTMMFMVHDVLKYFLTSWWSVIQNIVNWLNKCVQYHLSKEYLKRTCSCSVIPVPVGGLASLGTRASPHTVCSCVSKMYRSCRSISIFSNTVYVYIVEKYNRCTHKLQKLSQSSCRDAHYSCTFIIILLPKWHFQKW